MTTQNPSHQAEQHHRIDYLELPASDIEQMKHFYGAVFGWRFEDFGPDYASFHDGRLAGGFDKDFPPGKGGGPLPVLYSRALEDTRSRVLAHGGRVVRDIFSFPGGRRFHFADPTGNELAVWSE